MRAINRPGSQLLGANGRDDGPIVSYISVVIMKFCHCFCRYSFIGIEAQCFK